MSKLLAKNCRFEPPSLEKYRFFDFTRFSNSPSIVFTTKRVNLHYPFFRKCQIYLCPDRCIFILYETQLNSATFKIIGKKVIAIYFQLIMVFPARENRISAEHLLAPRCFLTCASARGCDSVSTRGSCSSKFPSTFQNSCARANPAPSLRQFVI